MKMASAMMDFPRIGVRKGDHGKIIYDLGGGTFMIDFGGQDKTIALLVLEQFSFSMEESPPEGCPDALLPDGDTCPRCGWRRGPSGAGGGSWVHVRESGATADVVPQQKAAPGRLPMPEQEVD
jgi:hypothetical protein